jgi:hypothetical protein
VTWEKVSGPHLGNMVAAIRTSGAAAELVLEHASGTGLKPMAKVPLG